MCVRARMCLCVSVCVCGGLNPWCGFSLGPLFKNTKRGHIVVGRLPLLCQRASERVPREQVQSERPEGNA